MKKFYFLILFMCLAIGNAWADNGFELLGIKPNVASGSTGSWPASSLVSGASGTITYTPNTKTLVFDNVWISGIDKKVVYNKSVDGLTIVFKGECTFYSTENILRYEMATILDGSASTKVEMHVLKKTIGDDKETFYSNNEYNTGTHDPYASLEIKNFPYLRLSAAGDYCISHTYGAVDIKDSHVLMESGKGTIHTNMYALGWFSLVRLTDCYYAGNYYWMTTDDCRDIATKTSDDKAEKVKTATILRSSEYTGVRLDGIAVLSTDSRWNASTKTLTLNETVFAVKNYTYPAAITVEKPGITIDGGGHGYNGYKYGLDYGNIGSSSAPTTVRNMVLQASTAGIYGVSGYINIGDDVIVLSEDYAVKGGYVTFCPTADHYVALQPINTTGDNITYFTKKAILVKKLKFQDCEIYVPQGAAVNDTTIVGKGWNQWVEIRGYEKYDLYVNGTQVNEKNKDNLTSLLGSNATGTLKYNPSTNILTMNNLKAAPAYNPYGYTHLIAGKSLTIVVEGENEITASMTNFCTIVSTGLTITKGSTSTSKLTLKGTPVQGFFISTSSPVIIDVTLAIEGNGNEIGIYNDNGIGFINNATISIKNAVPLYGMWATSGVYGNLQRSDGPAITINPSTKQLVYFYDNATSPSTDVVTEAINIYPIGTYSVKVNGNTPQSYTEQNGVCYDEFSNRLYLRNTSVNGKITFSRSDYESNMWSPTIYTIGDCSVTNSDIPFAASVHGLTFTGPGTLNLTNAGTKEAAARFTGCSGDVVVKNTTLKMNAAAGMICTHSDYTSYLKVINSTVEAHGTSGYYMLNGFTSLLTSGCALYVPQNGYYYNTDNYHGNLRNADGTVASDMLILLEAPQGDLNVDGKVDIADVVCVLDVMAVGGYDSKTDLNGDGKVDIADVVAVLDLMAKQKS
jgi:hypothetical protein